MTAAKSFSIKINKPKIILLPKDNFYNTTKKAKEFIGDFDAKEVLCEP